MAISGHRKPFANITDMKMPQGNGKTGNDTAKLNAEISTGLGRSFGDDLWGNAIKNVAALPG